MCVCVCVCVSVCVCVFVIKCSLEVALYNLMHADGLLLYIILTTSSHHNLQVLHPCGVLVPG